jgi:hypothetical protein
MQSAVEDVIMLEYMQQIDHGIDTEGFQLLTKMFYWRVIQHVYPIRSGTLTVITRLIIPMQVIMILNSIGVLVMTTMEVSLWKKGTTFSQIRKTQ